jgi:methylated-DNA-[protein]-cysteine S-methyltransferase
MTSLVEPGARAQPAGALAEAWLDSPFGRIVVASDGLAIRRLRLGRADERPAPDPGLPLLAEAIRQLRAYLAGRPTVFRLPLSPDGGRFQRMVWAFVHDIPYGATLTYGELASLTGSGARAVAKVCGQNPIPILIPCHRVVGKRTLGGFSAPGGQATKQKLLALEGAILL